MNYLTLVPLILLFGKTKKHKKFVYFVKLLIAFTVVLNVFIFKGNLKGSGRSVVMKDLVEFSSKILTNLMIDVYRKAYNDVVLRYKCDNLRYQADSEHLEDVCPYLFDAERYSTLNLFDNQMDLVALKEMESTCEKEFCELDFKKPMIHLCKLIRAYAKAKQEENLPDDQNPLFNFFEFCNVRTMKSSKK